MEGLASATGGVKEEGFKNSREEREERKGFKGEEGSGY